MAIDALIPVPGGVAGALVLALCGILICFHGSGLLRFALGLSGFLLTGSAGGAVAALFTHSVSWTAGAFVLCGILGAALAGVLVPVGTFVMGAVLGFAAGSVFTSSALVAGACALAAGAVFVLLKQRVLAAGTAALGALMVVEGLLRAALGVQIVGRLVEPWTGSVAAALVFASLWAVLAVAGYRAQSARKKRRRGDEDEDD